MCKHYSASTVSQIVLSTVGSCRPWVRGVVWVEPDSRLIRCLCRHWHEEAARLHHWFCLRVVMAAPPRKEEAVGCLGFGRTGGGCNCHRTDGWETTPETLEPPGPWGAEWVLALSRAGAADPSCRTPPPRRWGERQEVHPPSGPAGQRNVDWERHKGWGRERLEI